MKKHRIESLNFRDGLMIGDFVYNNGKAYEWDAYDYCRSQKGMEEIEPIPLTDEILKANGFRLHAKYTGADIWMDYNHNIEVVVADYAETIRVFTFDGVDDGTDLIFLPDIGRTRYLHELQHALRLCGLNELADNFIIV